MRTNRLGRHLPEMNSCASTLISPVEIHKPVRNHVGRGEDDGRIELGCMGLCLESCG